MPADARVRALLVVALCVFSDAVSTLIGLSKGFVERGPIARHLIYSLGPLWFSVEFVIVYSTIYLASLLLARVPRIDAGVLLRRAAGAVLVVYSIIVMGNLYHLYLALVNRP